MAALLLNQPAEHEEVVIRKPSIGTRVGVSLWNALEERAVVYSVIKGLPASEPMEDNPRRPKLGLFEEIIAVNGAPCSSALHAIAMIRGANRNVVIRKLACPTRLVDACRMVQRCWRLALMRRWGLEYREVVKAASSATLGIRFSPDFQLSAIVESVNPSGLAAQILSKGDRVLRINGESCDLPTNAAMLLREASGRVHLVVQPVSRVDVNKLLFREASQRVEDEDEQGDESPPNEVSDKEDGKESVGKNELQAIAAPRVHLAPQQLIRDEVSVRHG